MSNTNRAKDRDDRGRLKRNLRRPKYPMSTPGWWVRLQVNRPRRHENRYLCHRVLRGFDPEGMTWPLGSHKPHVYYW
ncbi:hypothetical protein [Hydrocarboniphaga effusa]|jgi:hypothetical protein|uniref:hypothetical protein n=1 Tax=Hydrocarboniphaga effusa TaxID=243629 RepID=UPI00398BEF3B